MEALKRRCNALNSAATSLKNIRKYPTRIALQRLNNPQQFKYVNRPLATSEVAVECLLLRIEKYLLAPCLTAGFDPNRTLTTAVLADARCDSEPVR
jgi:hypothetical protein